MEGAGGARKRAGGFFCFVATETEASAIAAADLVLNGQPVIPKRHDIIETDTGLRYEVLAPVGQSEWQYVDPFNKLMRIHTMAIG